MPDLPLDIYFEVAVGNWGIAPSEFWNMTPTEWLRIFEFKRPKDPETDYAGTLSENDVQDLYDLLE